MKSLALSLVLCLCCPGQPPSSDPNIEEKALGQALGEAGSSPIELTRALEAHLTRFPGSARRAELERLLARAAIENKDDRRIILYGERVLARDPDDIQVLDHVTHALLATDAKDTSERALKYARHYEELIDRLRKQPPPAHMGKGQWQEELDRGQAKAIVMQARATGNLGRIDQGLELARNSWEAFPSAESAREIARWLVRAGRLEEAVRHFADAFTVAEHNSDADRAKDRERMGELYTKLKGSEKGLGDIVLAAYDRTSALLAERRARLGEADPNLKATRLLDFTLSGVHGDKLELASLKGKAVVFDFWATWCGPCRAQHPLYEQVKRRFASNKDVAFVSVDTDEDRSAVEPFLQENTWTQAVYFEDGLMRTLQISSIPTTIVVNRRGEVISRMNGYLPDRFVDMLSERIEEALR